MCAMMKVQLVMRDMGWAQRAGRFSQGRCPAPGPSTSTTGWRSARDVEDAEAEEDDEEDATKEGNCERNEASSEFKAAASAVDGDDAGSLEEEDLEDAAVVAAMRDACSAMADLVMASSRSRFVSRPARAARRRFGPERSAWRSWQHLSMPSSARVLAESIDPTINFASLISFAEGFFAAVAVVPEAEAEEAATNAGFSRALKSFARALAVLPEFNASEKEAEMEERVGRAAAEDEEDDEEGTRHTSVEKAWLPLEEDFAVVLESLREWDCTISSSALTRSAGGNSAPCRRRHDSRRTRSRWPEGERSRVERWTLLRSRSPPAVTSIVTTLHVAGN